jgi:hypothetical protein
METQNWSYKERDRGYISYFLPQQTPRRLAYFETEKDSSASKRSFYDELRFAKQVLEPILSKDIADLILRYCYATEKIFPNDIDIKKNIFNTFYTTITDDTLYLTRGDKQALLYLMNHTTTGQPIIIEGRDKHFSQKMSQHILELPLPIRQKIAEKYGKNMLCNTHYEHSMRNTVLGEDENTHIAYKQDLARISQFRTKAVITFLICYMSISPILSFSMDNALTPLGAIALFIGSLAATLESHTPPDDINNNNNFTNNELTTRRCIKQTICDQGLAIVSGLLMRNREITASIGLGAIAGMGITESAGAYVYNKVFDCCKESPEERSNRLGFEIKSLL